MPPLLQDMLQARFDAAFFEQRPDPDVLAGLHQAFLDSQQHDARFSVPYAGRTVQIQVPAGVYHPAEAASSPFLLRHLPVPPPGTRVLDLACGSGVLGIALALHGADVTLADLDPRAVACARDNAARNQVPVQVLQSDLLASIPGRFDWVVANLPFMHQPPPGFTDPLGCDPDGQLMRRFLREAPGHVRPGGQVMLIVSNLSDPDCLEQARAQFEFRCIGLECSLPAGVWRWLVQGSLRESAPA